MIWTDDRAVFNTIEIATFISYLLISKSDIKMKYFYNVKNSREAVTCSSHLREQWWQQIICSTWVEQTPQGICFWNQWFMFFSPMSTSYAIYFSERYTNSYIFMYITQCILSKIVVLNGNAERNEFSVHLPFHYFLIDHSLAYSL